MVRGTALVLLAFLLLAVPLSAQKDERKENKKKSLKDYLHLHKYDHWELQEYWQKSEHWKQLTGPFGLGGYYIPPSHQPGPYPGPPLQIWGRGFGASLWRDPVTGWPIQ